MAAASERGIVVEYSLFCPFYEEDLWAVNPMNARNNVNGVGNIPRNEAYTGKHRDLQEKQEAFVRKVVRRAERRSTTFISRSATSRISAA